jgi:thiol:disulfide interchange protein DsbD
VLTGLLAFVAKTANTTLGATLLFIYALGIGVPFFLIGVFTVRLPRGGVWMEWVKSVLGIMLVALAFSYLKDAFPWARDTVKALGAEVGQVPGAVLAAVLVVVGVLVGAVHRSFKEGARDFGFKALGVALVVGALVVRGGALDARPVGELWVRMGLQERPVAPSWQWHHVMPAKTATFDASQFEQVLAVAKKEGRPVLIDFFADWCAACKELDRLTYPSTEVISQAQDSRFLTIKIDATNSEDRLDALMEQLGVEGLPTVAFVNPDGTVLTKPRVTGFLEPVPFAAEMQKVVLQ